MGGIWADLAHQFDVSNTEWCAFVCKTPGQQDTCPYKQGELAVCEIMGDSIAAKQSKYKILEHLVKLLPAAQDHRVLQPLIGSR